MLFILEDNAERIAGFANALGEMPHHIERTVPDAIAWLSRHRGEVTLYSLDNDLVVPDFDGEEGEGWELCEWILENAPGAPIITHTTNGHAGTKMQLACAEAGREFRRIVPYDGFEWIAEAWIDAVRELIGRAAGAPAGPAGPESPAEATYRIWFAPAWDPSMGIDLELRPGAARLRLRGIWRARLDGAPGGIVGALLAAQAQVDAHGGLLEDYLGEAVEETTVTGGRLQAAAAELVALQPFEMPSGRQACSDGMNVTGSARARDGRDHSFVGWSPTPEDSPRLHAYATTLFNLARDCCSTEPAARLLAGVHHYLDPGLGAMDLGGTPRHVHLFGDLRVEHDHELRRFLGAIGDEQVVVDMTSVRRIDERLGPAIVDAHRRWPRARWIASREAGEALAALGIPHEIGDRS